MSRLTKADLLTEDLGVSSSGTRLPGCAVVGVTHVGYIVGSAFSFNVFLFLCPTGLKQAQADFQGITILMEMCAAQHSVD